ncbi:MAG: flagellin [Nanoarchaeota archaeon]
MGLIINTNISALVAQRNLKANTVNLNKSLERLASGYKINRASDDAAGLSISENLRGQIRGTQKAAANAQDGINILNIGEAALSTVGENLQRIRELTIQAANDTNSTTERSAIALEVQARLEDINRIALTTKGNNVYLLDGSSSQFTLQVGANSTATQNTINIGVVFADSRYSALSISTTVTVGAGGAYESGGTCRAFLNEIDAAINNVFTRRAQLGAYMNRLESTVQSLTIQIENLKASESRIRDVDIASETGELTKNQILQQSATAILAQANQAPALALQLLQ